MTIQFFGSVIKTEPDGTGVRSFVPAVDCYEFNATSSNAHKFLSAMGYAEHEFSYEWEEGKFTVGGTLYVSEVIERTEAILKASRFIKLDSDYTENNYLLGKIGQLNLLALACHFHGVREISF